MSRVLVIGCGGVASVAIQKCCQVDEVFTEMCIASRTKEKCDALVEKLKGKTKTVLTIKVARELGSERRETVRSLSIVCRKRSATPTRSTVPPSERWH